MSLIREKIHGEKMPYMRYLFQEVSGFLSIYISNRKNQCLFLGTCFGYLAILPEIKGLRITLKQTYPLSGNNLAKTPRIPLLLPMRWLERQDLGSTKTLR